MPEIKDMQSTDNRFVSKWGNKLFAIGDYGVGDPLPTVGADYFGTDHLPLAVPTGMKVMGYITTDGVTSTRDVSSNETQMDQDLEPVREDLESMKSTLKVVFGESNAWVNALYEGMPVASWPASPSAAWSFNSGGLEDMPLYRGLILTQDGVGANAKYRVEACHRIKPVNFGDRSMARANVESFDFTFSVQKDPKTGVSVTRAQDGPFYATVTP